MSSNGLTPTFEDLVKLAHDYNAGVGSTTLSSSTWTAMKAAAMGLVGVNARTLILLDSAADESDTSKWVASSGWGAKSLITKSTMTAVLPGTSTPIAFREPPLTLPTVPSGSRAIWTVNGPILLDGDGPHFA